MYLNNEDRDEQADDIVNKIEEASEFHAEQILKQDYVDVGNFIAITSDKILNMIDDIPNDQLAINLTSLVGAILGGLGKACLELKAENAMLKEDILDELQGDQNPDLN